MAEKSMKNGSKTRWMETTYIKPISAYITGRGTPISSLYQPISQNGENLYQAYIG